MEAIVANVVGKLRWVEELGRKYVVAPLTLIVPGVLNGSKGPLYYPSEEIKKNHAAWNGMPIVVYHPTDTSNKPIPATSPGVLEKSGIGQVRKAKAHGRLTAEGWFDVENTLRVDKRILENLESGQPIQLSTGLYTHNEPAPPGTTYNGVSYTHIARGIDGGGYIPDHLAILPDREGACSLAMGCGVLVNQSHRSADMAANSLTVTTPIVNQLQSEPQKKSVWAKLGEVLGITSNEPSNADVREQLQHMLKERFGRSENGSCYSSGCYISDIYSDTVVYSQQDRLYRLGYSVNDEDVVELSKDMPEEVVRVTSYKSLTDNQAPPINPSGDGQTVAPAHSGDNMAVVRLTADQRQATIRNLITCNCPGTPWKGKDEAALNALGDEALAVMEDCRKAMTANANPQPLPGFNDPQGNRWSYDEKNNRWLVSQPTTNVAAPQAPTMPPVPQAIPPLPVAQPVSNTVGKPKNVQEWIDLMPPDAQPVWNAAMDVAKAKKQGLIERLTANMAGQAREAALAIYNEMDPQKLEVLAQTMPDAPQPPQYPNVPNNSPVANFFGAGGGPSQIITHEEPLMSPVYNYGPGNN